MLGACGQSFAVQLLHTRSTARAAAVNLSQPARTAVISTSHFQRSVLELECAVSSTWPS